MEREYEVSFKVKTSKPWYQSDFAKSVKSVDYWKTESGLSESTNGMSIFIPADAEIKDITPKELPKVGQTWVAKMNGQGDYARKIAVGDRAVVKSVVDNETDKVVTFKLRNTYFAFTLSAFTDLYFIRGRY